jgi:hypothetical protein
VRILKSLGCTKIVQIGGLLGGETRSAASVKNQRGAYPESIRPEKNQFGKRNLRRESRTLG